MENRDPEIARAFGEARTDVVDLSGGRRGIIHAVPWHHVRIFARERLREEELLAPAWPTQLEETADGVGQEIPVEDPGPEFFQARAAYNEREAYFQEVAIFVLGLRVKIPDGDDRWEEAYGILGLEIPEDPIERLYAYIRTEYVVTEPDRSAVFRAIRRLSLPTREGVERQKDFFESSTEEISSPGGSRVRRWISKLIPFSIGIASRDGPASAEE